MIPSPAELTYFMEVASCLNLTRAAERLGVSQPSLSLSIRKLETTLETPLFIRHKQGVNLTPAGEQLLAQVKTLLTHWDKTKSLARTSHQEAQGRVIIGCRSAAAHHMSSFVQHMLIKHPNIEINFDFQNSISTTEGVINSSVDIGIVNNPIQHHDLIIHKFADTYLTFWVGQGDHDIQNIHSGKAVIICEPGVSQVQVLLRELEKANVKIARMITANSLEVIANFTLAGCGIGILPSCLATRVYANKLKPVENMPSYRNEVCLIYRQENRDVQAIKTVLYALKEFSKIAL